MNKVIRDGNVAVLYSPGYGAGWYSWNKDRPDMLFDATMVGLIENGKRAEAETYATLKWSEAYIGGLRDLEVTWIREGRPFKIDEYDGYESVVYSDSDDWIVA